RRDLEQVDHNLDPLLFSSVIKNLVINAVEACGKKGTIDISVRKNRSALVVELTDSGADIPSPIADHIFEPFFSTKEGGYGLGLAIVRRIVELHGGEIRLSKPGTKKTFTITIP
ncbi:MAG TPA: ATP-binding protein, partial [bacterium (Candidatus Stahlbacteria)]|nr:ATP-binding protein [Candidatus Stahlbacteria bacterium]